MLVFQDTELEERIYRTDLDCLLAGKPLTQFDLTASSSIQLADYPELRLSVVVTIYLAQKVITFVDLCVS